VAQYAAKDGEWRKLEQISQRNAQLTIQLGDAHAGMVVHSIDAKNFKLTQVSSCSLLHRFL
jgi:hypothetical protein